MNFVFDEFSCYMPNNGISKKFYKFYNERNSGHFNIVSLATSINGIVKLECAGSVMNIREELKTFAAEQKYGIVESQKLLDARYNPQEIIGLMGKGKAATKAKNKYNGENYDRINLTVKIGKKEEYAKLAEAAGMSLNGFIIDCIENRKK